MKAALECVNLSELIAHSQYVTSASTEFSASIALLNDALPCYPHMTASPTRIQEGAPVCRCVASRELLKHHQKCQSTTCSICVPVKQHVQQQRLAAQRKVQQQQINQQQQADMMARRDQGGMQMQHDRMGPQGQMMPDGIMQVCCIFHNFHCTSSIAFHACARRQTGMLSSFAIKRHFQACKQAYITASWSLSTVL